MAPFNPVCLMKLKGFGPQRVQAVKEGLAGRLRRENVYICL